MIDQPDLFGTPVPLLPQGFRYCPDAVHTALQDDILAHVRTLPFKAFDFHGFEGKRRIVSFGWRYDFAQERLAPTEPMPEFLLPLRELAARFAGVVPETLEQALVTEYGPGAPIGWHKDKSVFGVVVGVSLLSACTFSSSTQVGRQMAARFGRSRAGVGLCAFRCCSNRMGTLDPPSGANKVLDYIPRVEPGADTLIRVPNRQPEQSLK